MLGGDNWSCPPSLSSQATRRSQRPPESDASSVEGRLFIAVDKIRHYDEVLGGITRLTFQMDHTTLPHATLRSIELLGTRVAPALQTPALVSV
jgi:hypothetical protein